MGIVIDGGATHATCNGCGAAASTDRADGVVPMDWGTGQLWIDLRLDTMRQIPICFCPDCIAQAAMIDPATVRLNFGGD